MEYWEPIRDHLTLLVTASQLPRQCLLLLTPRGGVMEDEAEGGTAVRPWAVLRCRREKTNDGAQEMRRLSLLLPGMHVWEIFTICVAPRDEVTFDRYAGVQCTSCGQPLRSHGVIETPDLKPV